MLKLTRRRCIAITAAAAGVDLLPCAATASPAAELVTWHGTALGASATVRLHHPDRAAGELLIARSVAELRRLEALFSLYRADSVLVALNRQGALVAPPPELVALLTACARYAALTDGAFDATVQPLWSLYARHFAHAGADQGGPREPAIADALGKVGHRGVLVGQDRIVLARRGMQLTLNGIAQGYITDRVIALLQDAGVTRTLVDMGETRCLGRRPDGEPWRIGIADPDRPDRVRETLSLVHQAVATSGGYGFRFDADGRFNHLFDPGTGRSADRYRSVTCVMSNATAADALSTAFSVMTEEAIEAALGVAGGGRVHLTRADGSRTVLVA
jgi:thiamine biosynthesis lipoprotein